MVIGDPYKEVKKLIILTNFFFQSRAVIFFKNSALLGIFFKNSALLGIFFKNSALLGIFFKNSPQLSKNNKKISNVKNLPKFLLKTSSLVKS